MIVYAFPGQGSQSPAMGLDMAGHFAVFETLAAEASDVLHFDLIELVRDGGDKLHQTTYTQPALLWAGYASFMAFTQHRGPAPDIVCGHSLGEYTALVAAGVLSFADGVRLVHKRGQLMQQQVAPEDALMAAIIGLSDEQVSELCAEVNTELGDDQAVNPANFNARGQVVVAGKSAALASLQSKGKQMGAKRILPLAMSVPSHCGLMEHARLELAAFANSVTFRDAEIPVVHNIDANTRSKADDIKTALLNQLTHPVLWRQILEGFSNASDFIESGPGSVLQGLAKRALPNVRLHGIGNESSFSQAVDSFGLAPLR